MTTTTRAKFSLTADTSSLYRVSLAELVQLETTWRYFPSETIVEVRHAVARAEVRDTLEGASREVVSVRSADTIRASHEEPLTAPKYKKGFSCRPFILPLVVLLLLLAAAFLVLIFTPRIK